MSSSDHDYPMSLSWRDATEGGYTDTRSPRQDEVVVLELVGAKVLLNEMVIEFVWRWEGPKEAAKKLAAQRIHTMALAEGYFTEVTEYFRKRSDAGNVFRCKARRDNNG